MDRHRKNLEAQSIRGSDHSDIKNIWQFCLAESNIGGIAVPQWKPTKRLTLTAPRVLPGAESEEILSEVGDVGAIKQTARPITIIPQF